MAMTAVAQRPDYDQDKRSRLQGIIARESALTGGDFRLASGGRSTIFFDMKKSMLDPEGANLIADLILDHLAQDKVEYIGGLVMGSVPIVSVVCAKSHFPDRKCTRLNFSH